MLEPTSGWYTRNLTKIDRYTYWNVPLYLVSQSPWFQVFGFGLFQSRMYSLMWGVVTLAAWFLIMAKLGRDLRMAFLTVALLAVDFQFLWASGVARMDMMCVALGSSGIAAFLWLRESRFSMAVLVSHGLMVMAALSHPLALNAFAALVVLTLYYDWRRVRFQHVALAVLPYLVGAACWGLYIAQDPALFYLQFRANIADRVVVSTFLDTLHKQFVQRYLHMYGWAPDTRGLSHIKIVVLAVYVAGLVGAWSSRRIRADRDYRAVLLLWLVSTVTLSAVDNEIHHFYLLYFVIPLVAVLALWLSVSWDSGAVPRWLLAGLVVALVCVQMLVTASRLRQNPYRNQYLPAMAYLEQHARPGGRIFGSAELAWALGFEGQVVDDYRLGYKSGKTADLVVLDHNRYQEWIPHLAVVDPEAHRFATSLLDREYQLAFENHEYRIYARKN